MYIGTYNVKCQKGKILLPINWTFSNGKIYAYSMEEILKEKPDDRFSFERFPFLLCSQNNFEELINLGVIPFSLTLNYLDLIRNGINIKRAYLVLSSDLITKADLGKKVCLLGCGNYFEIWNPDIYENYKSLAFNNPDFSSLELKI